MIVKSARAHPRFRFEFLIEVCVVYLAEPVFESAFLTGRVLATQRALTCSVPACASTWLAQMFFRRLGPMRRCFQRICCFRPGDFVR